VGAFVYIIVSEVFRVWVKSGHLIFFGVLIIAIIIFFPNGIVGTLKEMWARRRRAGMAAGAGAQA
jgi:branched-chain amino acid transport system permease protein